MSKRLLSTFLRVPSPTQQRVSRSSRVYSTSRCAAQKQRVHRNYISLCHQMLVASNNNRRLHRTTRSSISTCSTNAATDSTQISKRWFSDRNTKSKSPYAILKLRTSATEEDIKAAFRRLAKQYHPDLNTTHSRKEGEALMAELIDAYEQLLDDDFGGRIGDSRVALACEMYTISELRMDRLHDVYSLKLTLLDDDSDEDEGCIDIIAADSFNTDARDLSPHSIIEIKAHPHDSVSDLKRAMQSTFEEEWGLIGRRLDRDGIATGWELVNDADGSILSYHLFLSSYRLKSGDLIHAVVRKNHAEENV